MSMLVLVFPQRPCFCTACWSTPALLQPGTWRCPHCFPPPMRPCHVLLRRPQQAHRGDT